MFNISKTYKTQTGRESSISLNNSLFSIGRAFFMICLLSISISALAQNSFQVNTKHKTESYQPGSRHSLVFEVVNLSSNPLTLKPELQLPASWDLITQGAEVILKGNETGFALISFYIPFGEEPGTKQGVLRISSNDQNAPVLKDVFFEIAEYHDLQVRYLSAPQYTQAGDLIEATFEIKNKGNVNEKIRLSSNNELKGEENREIGPDSVIVVTVTEKTSGKINYLQNISCDLEVLNESTAVSKKAYSSTKVFPTKIASRDAYFRYPIEASIYYNSYRNENETFNSKFYELRGNGYLDQTKNHHLNFIVRGPNQAQLTRFGINDQYSLIYKNRDRTTLFLGDHVFNINRLGFMGRYGLGVRLDQRVQNWVFSAFYTKPRLSFFSKEPIFGGKVSYNASEHLNIGFSFSSSKEIAQYSNYQAVKSQGESGQIGVFEANYEDDNTQIKMEVATSITRETMDYATDINLSHIQNRFSYRGALTMAGENYFGTLSNSLRYSNSLNYNLTKWNFGVGQGYSKVHERLDSTLYGVRPYFENYFASVGYRINNRNFINLRADQRNREDQSYRKSFNYREQGIDYRYKYTGNRMSLSFNGRMAQTENLISENRERRNTSGEFLSVNYRFSKSFSVRGNFNHNRTNRYSLTNSLTDYYLYGGGFNLNFSRSLRLGASYNSGFSPEESYRKRDFLNATALARIGVHHQIEARVNYYMNPNNVSNKEMFAFLKYTYRFGAPLKKVLKQGGVRGYVVSNDPSIKIRGVQIIAAGNSVRSDGKGRFELNNLAVGSNYLIIDESTLPTDVVAAAKLPLEVSIDENVKTVVNIELVKAARVNGKLLVEGSEKEINLEGYLKLENDSFTYYIESDRLGNFSFQKIVPGVYKLTLMRLKKDSGLVPVSNQFTINTQSKSALTLFPLKAKERKIKIKNNNFKIGN